MAHADATKAEPMQAYMKSAMPFLGIPRAAMLALRERAYQAPVEVRAFCAEYAQQLAPLTVRQALERIDAANP